MFESQYNYFIFKKMKISQKIYSFVLLFIVFISTSFGQENHPINLSDNWEVWFDKVPVSGEIRVGIMTSNEEVKINPTYFYVMIPKHAEKFLFCEISSRDGRYEASVSYDISNLKPGSHKFILPTQHINELKNYHSKDITILTSIGDKLSGDPTYFTSASWEPINSYPANIYILLNSEKKTSIVVENKKLNTQNEYPCEKIVTDSSIAYNCLCKIPTNVLDASSELFIKQRVRRMRKISYNSYPITFKLPSNENW